MLAAAGSRAVNNAVSKPLVGSGEGDGLTAGHWADIWFLRLICRIIHSSVILTMDLSLKDHGLTPHILWQRFAALLFIECIAYSIRLDVKNSSSC